MTISAQVGFDSFLRFTIANPKQGETPRIQMCLLITKKSEDGKSTHYPYV